MKTTKLSLFICTLLLAGSSAFSWGQQQQPSKSATPTADEIIERYVKALGGKAAIEKITSRVSHGTVEMPAANASGTIEIYEKAPNKLSIAMNVPELVNSRQIFDGTNEWLRDAPDGKVHQAKGAELDSFRRGAEFYRSIKLKEMYSKLVLKGTEKIQVRDGMRETYVIEASWPQGKPDKLYFDTETGLLLRTDSVEKSEEGSQPTREYTADYKEVDGVKLPFTIREVSADGPTIIRLTDVKQNVQIDDAVFARPKD